MLIDWFTVAAQAVNFLVLVWLLKRFLFQPIRHALDAREKRIAAELADAAARQAEAAQQRDQFAQRNRDFEHQRAALLRAATDAAEAERQRLVAEAREAAEAVRARREETLRTDARNLHQALARRTQQEVFAIARRALADLATTSLEERVAAVFIGRLRQLDSDARAGLTHALTSATAPAVVRSAFALPVEQRAAIQQAVNETFATTVPLRFETAPELVVGIELGTDGQKVAWSIADYLRSLEKGVGELLQDKRTPATVAEPAPGKPVPVPTQP